MTALWQCEREIKCLDLVRIARDPPLRPSSGFISNEIELGKSVA
jgi:hypothetical protein